MSTERIERIMEQLLAQCQAVATQLAQLSEEDLAKATTRRWAPTVGEYLTGSARHKRDHVNQVMYKREALGLAPTAAQQALADLMVAQGELIGALMGLSDADLDTVPEGQSWSMGQVLDHMLRSDGGFIPEVEQAVGS
jgi:hypothetical protein